MPAIPDAQATLTELLAKTAIVDALGRYCRAMDRIDVALGRSVFHPDAIADYGDMFSGSGYDFVDVIPTEVAHLKGVNIQFGGGPAPTDWFEMCDLVSSAAVDTAPLVGEVVGFDGLLDAFDRARHSTAPPRIVFRPDVIDAPGGDIR